MIQLAQDQATVKMRVTLATTATEEMKLSKLIRLSSVNLFMTSMDMEVMVTIMDMVMALVAIMEIPSTEIMSIETKEYLLTREILTSSITIGMC